METTSSTSDFTVGGSKGGSPSPKDLPSSHSLVALSYPLTSFPGGKKNSNTPSLCLFK